MQSHKECIECPECGKRQLAEVLHTYPWWAYIHTCFSCKYVITESEWIRIAKEESESCQ